MKEDGDTDVGYHCNNHEENRWKAGSVLKVLKWRYVSYPLNLSLLALILKEKLREKDIYVLQI